MIQSHSFLLAALLLLTSCICKGSSEVLCHVLALLKAISVGCLHLELWSIVWISLIERGRWQWITNCTRRKKLESAQPWVGAIVFKGWGTFWPSQLAQYRYNQCLRKAGSWKVESCTHKYRYSVVADPKHYRLLIWVFCVLFNQSRMPEQAPSWVTILHNYPARPEMDTTNAVRNLIPDGRKMENAKDTALTL